MSKSWLITGTSRGFGRIWTEAALARGDRVAAAARDPASLTPLIERFGDAFLPLTVDVTDHAAVAAAVGRACAHFGALDVVVNNAGYGLFGAVEEISEAQARAQIETNLLGALWVTQAAVPHLRSQGHGHIIQVSSIGGIVALPMLGLYHASKWGLEGFSQSLAAELAPLGIAVTILEPSGYATDWSGASATWADPINAYDSARAALRAQLAATPPGDPAATAAAILELVDADRPPLRAFLGAHALAWAREEYARRIATWEQWDGLAQRAQGTQAAA